MLIPKTPAQSPASFKSRLRDALMEKGISAKDFATSLGLSYSSFLSYIDARAVIPAADTAVLIAQALGVTVEYLVQGEASDREGACGTHTQTTDNERLAE